MNLLNSSLNPNLKIKFKRCVYLPFWQAKSTTLVPQHCGTVALPNDSIISPYTFLSFYSCFRRKQYVCKNCCAFAMKLYFSFKNCKYNMVLDNAIIILNYVAAEWVSNGSEIKVYHKFNKEDWKLIEIFEIKLINSTKKASVYKGIKSMKNIVFNDDDEIFVHNFSKCRWREWGNGWAHIKRPNFLSYKKSDIVLI